ncbi:MAG: hypothetical protein ABI456_16115, partial [Ktedonobacteraceae bacterium]
ARSIAQLLLCQGSWHGYQGDASSQPPGCGKPHPGGWEEAPQAPQGMPDPDAASRIPTRVGAISPVP